MASEGGSQLEPLTVAAVAVVTWAAANVLHEGLGHGGACLLVGGKPLALTAIYFDGEPPTELGRRVEAAGGCIANLLAFLPMLALVRRGRFASPASRLAAWLFLSLNFLQPAGYLMFSGLGGVGDWARVAEGLLPTGVWRAGESALGAALYFGLGPRLLLPGLEPFLGAGPDRVARARRLMLLPYLVGGATYAVAGLLNPLGLKLVLLSALPASFGGMSLFAWGWQLAREPRGPVQAPPLGVPRSTGWLVAAAVALAVFVVLLGPGVELYPLGWPAHANN